MKLILVHVEFLDILPQFNYNLNKIELNFKNVIFLFQVWFKNRRAKWRKQKREEQERLRKLQLEQRPRTDESVSVNPIRVSSHLSLNRPHDHETDSSDLEVA